MTRLELWPGLLPLTEASWARESRLVAADGVLEVRRRRRVEQYEVRGCSMRPARPIRDLAVSFVVVFVEPSGDARCAIDLADWVPGGFRKADRRAARQLGEPFEDVRDALAEALGARVSSTEWTDELPRLVSAADLASARTQQLVLLALAVVAVLAPLTATIALGVVSGMAAVALVLLGMSPVRRWHPRSESLAWTQRAGHLRDEMSLTANGSVLWVMDTTTRRAGALPIGPLPWQVDRLDVDETAMQLSMRGVLAVDVPHEAWGDEAFGMLRSRVAQTDGITSRDRRLDRRAVTAIAMIRGVHRPGSIGGNLLLAALAGSAAFVTAFVAVPVAVLYAVAAVAALALAGEALVARRASPRKDTP